MLGCGSSRCVSGASDRPPANRDPAVHFTAGPAQFAAFLPAHLPVDGRCLSVHPNGRSFLYPTLDADRQEIYIATIAGRL